MKVCWSCRIQKELSRFKKHPNARDGVSGICKECVNTRIRKRYAEDEEFRGRRQRKGKKWYYANPEKVKALRLRFYINLSPEKRAIYNRKACYGLTDQLFREMKSRQGNKCALCSKSGRLVIDHDHATNEIRGLLCYGCNQLLGLFEKLTPELVRKINDYLENPPAKAVIEPVLESTPANDLRPASGLESEQTEPYSEV